MKDSHSKEDKIMRWKPNVTVATVISRTNASGLTEYLLVHEIRNGKAVYNQPAGHLDEDESLTDAAIRETVEETGWEVALTGLVGIYRFIAPTPNNEQNETSSGRTTYLRHVFSAKIIKHHPQRSLDDGIIEAVWMTYEEIISNISENLRSSLVKQAIDDYERGNVYPLSLLHEPL